MQCKYKQDFVIILSRLKGLHCGTRIYLNYICNVYQVIDVSMLFTKYQSYSNVISFIQARKPLSNVIYYY